MRWWKLVALIGASLLLLCTGYALGILLPAGIFVASPSVESEQGHEHEAAEDRLELTEEAVANLELRMQKVRAADGFRYFRVPAEVIEKPGHSDHILASPVNGIVTRIHVLPGQAVRPGDALFELEVIDESLAKSQLELLQALTRLEVVQAELERLSPLAESGTVAGRRKLELEYEQKQLEAQLQVRQQELGMHGLSEEQVERILRDRQLLRRFTVRMPRQLAEAAHVDGASAATGNARVRTVASESQNDGWDYTVEELDVFPGKSIRRGDDLCHLAYHTVLYIRGQAFENEVDSILALAQGERSDWPVTAEFGIEGKEKQRTGLTVRHVDNHVDPETQTFLFYVPLPNEVVSDSVGPQGRRYRTWRFKPGQRVHLLIPVAKYEQQIKLPLAAVVQEGPDAFVFRRYEPKHSHVHSHDGHSHSHRGYSHGGHPHDGDEHEDAYLVLERVPVHILHEDEQGIVVEQSKRFKPGDSIAMNRAYQLQLALKQRAGGGGGHGHRHGH